MNRSWIIHAVAIASLAAGFSTGRAQTAGQGEFLLSLEEARLAALENNLDLVVGRKDPAIAAQSVETEEAAFDPVFQASLAHFQPKGEPSVVISEGGLAFFSDVVKRTSAGVEWRQMLKFGASYAIGLDSVRIPVNGRDSYNSGLSLDFNLPLLRRRGTEANTSALLLAKSGVDTSLDNLYLQSEDVLKQVEDAYWDLLAARAALNVARESLTLAQDLLNLNRKKVEVGTLAPIEITQAEAGEAAREESVIVAEANVGNAEDDLRRLLGIDPADPRWTLTIVPTDRPEFAPKSVTLEETLRIALEKRPEMAVASRQLKDAELRERVAKTDLRHGLDLNANFSPSGNERDFQSFIPEDDGDPTTDNGTIVNDYGKLGTSLSEIWTVENYTWRAALIYSVPIGNRKAKAAAAVSTLEREKAEASMRNVEQNIRVDVRTAVRNVESGAKRVAAARSSTTLQRKKLEAEQKKFDNGMSTSFEVLTFQTDLQNAQLSEIEALLAYQKALADLERAKGTLLEARGLELSASR